MKLTDLIITANKNLMRNKTRTGLTILAIFVGCFAIISTTAIQAGTNKFIDGQMANFGGEGFIQIMSEGDNPVSMPNSEIVSGAPKEYNPDKVEGYEDFTPISEKQIEKVKQIKGIVADSVMISHFGNATYVRSAKNSKKFEINSTNILPTDSVKLDLIAGKIPNNKSEDFEVSFPEPWVSSLGFEKAEDAIGNFVDFVYLDPYTNAEIAFNAKIVGIQASSVVVDTPVVNSSLNDAIYNESTKYLPASVRDAVYVLGATYDYKNVDANDIKEELKKLKLTGLTADDIASQIKGVFDSIATIIRVFGAIALIAASIGIINTLLMSVQERTREIGLMKSFGMSRLKIFLSFTFEAMLLGFWGSVFGTLVSMMIGSGLNVFLHEDGQTLANLPTFQLFTYTPENVIMVIAIIMIISFVAGTAPALKAARKNPIDALRYE